MGILKAGCFMCEDINARFAATKPVKRVTPKELQNMTGAGCHNLPGHLCEAVSLLNRYHQQFGKVPDDLVSSAKYEIERSPLYIGIAFYSWLLCEYPALAELFCEDEGADGDDIGPLSLQIEKLAIRHETDYHR